MHGFMTIRTHTTWDSDGVAKTGLVSTTYYSNSGAAKQGLVPMRITSVILTTVTKDADNGMPTAIRGTIRLQDGQVG